MITAGANSWTSLSGILVDNSGQLVVHTKCRENDANSKSHLPSGGDNIIYEVGDSYGEH